MNIEEVKKYYQDKLRSHGSSAEGMDWKDQASQYLRFEVIAKYIDFTANPSILDVGCGSAEFLNFCRINDFKCDYKGLDLTPEMVDASNERFGAGTAIAGDLGSIGGGKYDYVIASGTFNAKLSADTEQWREFFYDSIQKMFEKSNKGVIFNCMTEHVDWTYDRLFYPGLSDISKFIVKNLSRNFIIDHSYELFEMTIFVSR